MAKAKVNLNLDHVLVKVRGATDAALEAIALQIEGVTRVNIQRNGQIDTGFMVNSVYSVSKRSTTYGDTRGSGTQTNRQGQGVLRKIAPPANLPSHASAAVAVGAEYAIFQELKKPFLFPAAETVAGYAEGTAEKVYKEMI